VTLARVTSGKTGEGLTLTRQAFARLLASAGGRRLDFEPAVTFEIERAPAGPPPRALS